MKPRSTKNTRSGKAAPKSSKTKKANRRSAPAASIDAYLKPLPPEQRRALERLRRTIRSIAPRAEETISYGIPTFRLDGKPIAYFAAAKNHLSYFPGAGLEELAVELEGFDTSKGTIRFQPDRPLPTALVRKLVRAHMARIGVGGARRGGS
jgi:uncharacterized protein YdhG (YjbR/CyaY superfamily)